MKPQKIYASVLEDTAKAQFDSAMEQPFTVAGALMPDAHTGYSLPIGAVVATDGVVLPAWVGYDIGCGMCALRLDGIDADEITANAKDIFDIIYTHIPVGFNVNQKPLPYSLDGLTEQGRSVAVQKKHEQALGSLGGGNHFIEVGRDEDGNAWVVIHSGSRGVGHGLATHYMKLAHPDGKCKEGHFGFDVRSQNGKDYIQDLAWCLDFALANRKEMMARVVRAITEALDIPCYELDFSELINRNHNHAVERDGLWIHRKGATHAEAGMLGVIPGNMRDGSFIVRGKGNPDSLYSSSHGAGRVLGRKEAKRRLDVSDFVETMHGVQALVDASTLDESPFAYKDIFEVMALQKDLVEVVAHVRPIINIKG
jgi:tRNA-splicing ligase RtcB (3'-phosphate/5'-hydroxy nucleic acid ligase)